MFVKDIKEKAYIQYNGPATVRTEQQLIFGSLTTGYIEYIISFEREDEQVELSLGTNYKFIGDIENVYIVYSKYSNYIVEIIE